jgi:hypothetical protein
MTKPSFYDKLTDEEKKEYDSSIKQASKTQKKSYVEKNIDVWKKFFDGSAGLRQFARDSTKAKSGFQYFFTRQTKTCFQYKSFVADLLEAIALVDGLSAQRKSMMKYELVKFLRGGQKVSKAGDQVVDQSVAVAELNQIARDKQKEREAQRVAENLEKVVAQRELNLVGKKQVEQKASVSTFKKVAAQTDDFEKIRQEKEERGECPYADGTPQAERWHLNRE